MKRCPKCLRVYPDDALYYCLDDGAILSTVHDPQATLPYTPRGGVVPTQPYGTPRMPPTRQGVNPYLVTTIIASLLLVIVAIIALWLGLRSKDDTSHVSYNASPTPYNQRYGSSPSPTATPTSTRSSSALESRLIGTWSWSSYTATFSYGGTGTYYDNSKKCYDFNYYLTDDVLTMTPVTSSTECGPGKGVYRISFIGDQLQKVYIENGYTTQWTRK